MRQTKLIVVGKDTNQGRQGDCLIETCSSLPKDTAPMYLDAKSNKNRTFLAYGEKSGHSHCLFGDDVQELFSEAEGKKFYKVKGKAWLIHGVAREKLEQYAKDTVDKALAGIVRTQDMDHDAISVAPGIYENPPQVEFAREIRRVTD